MNRLSRIEAEVIRLASEVKRIKPISGIGTMVADSPAGGGRAINVSSTSGGIGSSLHPFQVIRVATPEEASGTWVKVALYSMLLENAIPTSKITITGLNEAFELAAGERIWLEIDLLGSYDDPVEPTVGEIQHGVNWNGVDGDFFPLPFRYNTDDGTYGGTADDPPDNVRAEKIYVPIGYQDDPADPNSFGLADAGIGFICGDPEDGIRFIQQLSTHLILGMQCIDGQNVKYVMPFHAPQPEVDE